MKRLPEPIHLEIRIDEWQAAQGKTNAVQTEVDWRRASRDPVVTDVLEALPDKNEFVPIRLSDGRTELAPERWNILSEHVEDSEDLLSLHLHTAGAFVDTSHVEVGVLLVGGSAHDDAF